MYFVLGSLLGRTKSKFNSVRLEDVLVRILRKDPVLNAVENLSPKNLISRKNKPGRLLYDSLELDLLDLIEIDEDDEDDRVIQLLEASRELDDPAESDGMSSRSGVSSRKREVRGLLWSREIPGQLETTTRLE
eukprot:scaffold205496_cov53-Attheya_sp.AAC.1